MDFRPFDYQQGMIDHLASHDHAALFCGMGLGKTPCTLEAYRQLRERGDLKGVLVIAPLRVCTVTWPDQVARWQLPFKVANLRTKEGMQAWKDGSADIYLINFEMISGRGKKKGFLDEHAGPSMPVDTLLVDELSCLKANSKRTKSVIKARKHFKRVHGLTGTPSPNGLLDLFFSAQSHRRRRASRQVHHPLQKQVVRQRLERLELDTEAGRSRRDPSRHCRHLPCAPF